MLIKGLKVLICICMAILLAPFKVYADDYSNGTIVGFNVNLVSGETTTQNDLSTGYIYDIEWILDDYYIGSINLTFTVNGANSFTSQARNYYVNGNKFKASFWMYQGSGNNNSQERPSVANVTYTVNSHNLNKIPNNMIRWDFPIESYTFINQLFQYGYEISDLDTHFEYTYPLFNLPQGSTVISNWSNGSENYNQAIIFGIDQNINNSSAFYNLFDTNNFKLIDFKFLYRKDQPFANGKQFTIVKIEYNIQDSSNNNATITTKGNYLFMPIFHEYISERFRPSVTTDFAILYGLSNSYLDNIQKIANGTTASQTASQSSDSANQQLQQDSSTLFQQEDSFKSNMQSAMQNVPQFNVNTFGNKFMTSAQWVRTQYERMTNNTPFQHLITFSLLVGLSMILIGKVRK